MESDAEFREVRVTAVTREPSGSWSITDSEGWSFFVPKESPVEPRVGMLARFYGRGLGFTVRGLTLDGVEVFYRTAAQQEEHAAIQMYGKDAADWLARWDRGDSVWSVEMGGLGPGYEQCIQAMAAEFLRAMLADKPNLDGDWSEFRKKLDALPCIDQLGPSGAQYGAAVGLAAQIYRRGPRACFTDPAVKERLIQVSKTFPGMEEVRRCRTSS